MLPKPKKTKDVYLDHAATTYIDKAVLKAMEPYFSKVYGNPSSLYHEGLKANEALNTSRRTIAKFIGALPENIIFTGSGTESDNLAIYGIAKAHLQHGKHIISTPIEHHAVLHPLEDLKKSGWEITYVKVNDKGMVNVDDVIKAIRPDTILISIMSANNEVGAIQPIAEIGRKLLQYRKENKASYPFFHTDACQAAGYLNLDVEKLHVDLMTINASKIYGPKGIGMLYVRRGVAIKPLILGGEQERNLRAGTENIAGIVGFAKALELVQAGKDKETKRLDGLVKYFWDKLQKQIPQVKLNGPEIGPHRLVNNLNVSFAGIEGEALLLYLDEYGVMCSTGSACTVKSLDQSHVLKAMGIPTEQSRGSLRFTFGHCNTKQDIDYIMKYLPLIVEQQRSNKYEKYYT
ncbi:MAG: cysteine desulfurase [Parcubacteria group bacterium Gr01-1014_13]|nr:MAG: cysteine desulfurase [Parcubacteria group bacterium Gr01-1014_13]